MRNEPVIKWLSCDVSHIMPIGDQRRTDGQSLSRVLSVSQSNHMSVSHSVRQSVGRSVDQSVNHSVSQSVRRSAGRSFSQPVSRSVSKLFSQLVSRSKACVVDDYPLFVESNYLWWVLSQWRRKGRGRVRWVVAQKNGESCAKKYEDNLGRLQGFLRPLTIALVGTDHQPGLKLEK